MEASGADTLLTIHQTNYDEERAKHSKENWTAVVNELRKNVELLEEY